MNPLLVALLPVFGVIALGWVLRRSGLVKADAWPGITRLTYVGLSPALLFSVISRADLASITVGPAILAAAAGFLGMGALILLLRPLIPASGPSFTSIFQAGARWNGLLILALAIIAWGAEGEVLVSLIMVVTIPIVNIMAVTVLSVWGEGAKPDLRTVMMRIVTNPLILGCLAGGLANWLGVFQSGAIADMLALIGRAALPLILLSVGAGLDFAALKERPHLLAISVGLKLLVAPIVFGLAAWGLGATGYAFIIVVLVGASPSAGSAYVLAQQMGGDTRLTAGDVTATTLLSLLTIPIAMEIATRIAPG
tara:strand:- start:260 stop:1189 length:930 start_codon:yes stop_codon:yes gene_type:complete